MRAVQWGTAMVAMAAVATALVGGSANAGPAADLQGDRPDNSVVDSDAGRDDTGDYWTVERMENADPVDVPVLERSRSAPVDNAAQQADEAQADVATRRWFPPTRTPFGIRPTASSDAAVLVPKPYTNMPDRTVGRVFFTDDRGRDQSCSGVALRSANKSVVWTAGHCVESGRIGGFHRNWMFVPAYGSCGEVCAPVGRFRATKLFTTDGWASNGDYRVDLGAAVVAPLAGRRLTEVVGGQGLVTGMPERRWSVARLRNIGYPADAPFDGALQWMCVGGITGRDERVAGSGPDPASMSCDMSGGASGGPWILAVGRNGYGYVAGVTSYRYRSDRESMYSPVLGDEAAALFRRAATAPVRG